MAQVQTVYEAANPTLVEGDMAAIADLLELSERMALPGGVIVGHGEIGPDQAAMLLEINTRNRSLSAEQVTAFSRMMRNGDWLFNGASLAIGVDHSIQDGQHRLEAIVLSGTTQRFLVMLGLPPEAQDVTDTGRRRSASDSLGIRKVANSANAAATVRLLLAWASGSVLHTSYAVGNIEVVNFVEKHGEDLMDSVNVGLSARLGGLPISTAVVAAFHFRLTGLADVTRAQIDEFFARVCQGVDLTEGDPEFALRRLFLRRQQTGIRVTRSEALYYLIRTWNARMKGQNLAKLQLPKFGLRLDTFPTPISKASQAEVPTPIRDEVDEQEAVAASA